MLEKYLSRILTSKFENLVENFDENALNVSAWKGEISLQNILLKPNALDSISDYAIPFDIVYGKIGKLELKIPWSALGTKSSSLILTDVTLLLAPREVIVVKESDSKQRKNENNDSKEETVQALLNPKLLQHSMAASHKRSRLARFLSWLSSSLFSNLTVTIKNVHIRYEDSGNSLGFVWNNNVSNSKFAVGLTLQQFSIQNSNVKEEGTTDKNYKDVSITKKLVAVHQIAVYWDHGASLISNFVHKKNPLEAREHAALAFLIIEGCLDHISGKDLQHYRGRHTYVLQPFSPSVQFTIVGSVKNFPGEPVLPSTVILSLPPCRMVLSRTVFEDIAYLRKSFTYWHQSRVTEELRESFDQLNRIRPSVLPLNNSRYWWKYAIQATIILGRVGQKKRKRKGWNALACAVLDRQRYLKLYLSLCTSDDRIGVHDKLCLLEDELEAEEIALFRLHAYEKIIDNPNLQLKLDHKLSSEYKSLELEDVTAEIHNGKLSARSRHAMMYDAIRLLREGRKHTSKDENVSEEPIILTASSAVQWKTSLYCPKMSIQVNGRSQSNSAIPIARLSFACVQHQHLRRDGSWELDADIADIQLIDLGAKGSNFSTLIGPKRVKNFDNNDDKESSVVVSGKSFRRCIQLELRRKLVKLKDGIGSYTHSFLRLQPLEVVYTANSAERLKSVFSPIRTRELAGDYQRLATLMLTWQEAQRQRLIQALAHKQKQISVDIDIAAPVIIMPEEANTGSGEMLSIDLGRVFIRNIGHDDSYDDAWSLGIKDMQLQTCIMLSHQNPSLRQIKQQIIEPFSLEFKISTIFASRRNKRNTSILINASLPRLVFNLNSSSLQLGSRLHALWQTRRVESSFGQSPSSMKVQRQCRREAQSSEKFGSRSYTSRFFQFEFSAPIIAVKLEIDADISAADQKESVSIPVVNLAFRGIGGNFQQKVSVDGTQTTDFFAKMKALEAVDMYQQAGPDFALLLSSVPPSSMPDVPLRTLVDQPEDLIHPQLEHDLVSIKYLSQAKTTRLVGSQNKSSLFIRFHELFIEWNPETLAAIQKTVRTPSRNVIGAFLNESSDSNKFDKDFQDINLELLINEFHDTKGGVEVDSDDEFFDAIEDDAETFRSASGLYEDKEFPLLSDIVSSSSSVQSEDGISQDLLLKNSMHPLPPFPQMWLPKSPNNWNGTQFRSVFLNSLSPSSHSFSSSKRADYNSFETGEKDVFEPFELTFNLSTLRVAFNKETRHRRLVIAEMDDTSIRYMTREGGGSKTVARIGNLVFTDPSFSENRTLYHQILGLKPQGNQKDDIEPSLLELEFWSNPSDRKYNSIKPNRLDFESSSQEDKSCYEGVTINPETGEIRGCNNFVQITFSPMRFVYLQQLWFEIIDYFFEGITGYEVWGNVRPKQEVCNNEYLDRDLDIDDINDVRDPDLPGSKAEGVSFTCFKISMNLPEVLLPVQYRSQHFLRFNFESVEVSNVYSSGKYVINVSSEQSSHRVQWYNTCFVTFRHINLQSWCGTDLASGRQGSDVNPNLKVEMSWPTGPTRQMVVPKWKVRCEVDEIDLSLQSEDYALLQHVVLHNIGEPSRHLDEWVRFQEMPLNELQQYKEKIMVHYGYDKKDDEPSTYDIKVVAPVLQFNLLGKGLKQNVPIAKAMCLNLCWKMHRVRDFISRQKFVSNFVLLKQISEDGVKRNLPLLLPTKRGTARDRRPDVVYKSTFKPSGEMIKVLEIYDAGINLTYPSWMEVISFFSNLKEPKIMSSQEIQNSLQIGDRWYSISPVSPVGDSCGDAVDQTIDKKAPIAHSSQFRIYLESPRIVLDSCNDGSSVTLHMQHFDYLNVIDAGLQTSTKTFFLDNLELYTTTISASNRDAYSIENSLIRPWSVSGCHKTYMERDCDVTFYSETNVIAETLKARAAYSDLIIALNVTRQLLSDYEAGRRKQEFAHHSSASNRRPIYLKNEPKNCPEKGASKTHQNDLQHNLSISVLCDGIEILVVDDSMRHFATSQELMSFTLSKIFFQHEKASKFLTESYLRTLLSVEDQCSSSIWIIRIASLNLIDRLQGLQSPFRLAVSSDDPNPDSASQKKNEDNLQLEWWLHSTQEISSIGFQPSPKLHELLINRISDVKKPDSKQRWSVEYCKLLRHQNSCYHEVKATSFTLQWNPSTVIALQRFLGRLQKEVHVTFGENNEIIRKKAQNISAHDVHGRNFLDTISLPIRVKFSLNRLSICLNKEHQNRRLLKAILIGIECQLIAAVSANATFIGGIDEIQARDEDAYMLYPILQENREILGVNLKVRGNEENTSFLTFEYTSYAQSGELFTGDEPHWILQQTEDSGNLRIDDYLTISLASVQVTYIRGRTEELMDYLSNGLPGKGMGLTSNAAKGFINKRIQSQSFLELRIAAPELKIPEHETSGNGVILHLGDMKLRSWFEPESGPFNLSGQDWSRVLSISVLGLAWHAYFDHQIQRSDDSPIDLKIDLRKPKNAGKAMVVLGELSHVTLRLRYTYYALVRSVLSNNIGKMPDTTRWDNIEKAFWMESNSEEKYLDFEGEMEQRVEYSTSARFVRYGPKSRFHTNGSSDVQPLTSTSDAKVLDFGFKIKGIELTLNRDDDIDADIGSDGQLKDGFSYDMILLELETADVTLDITTDGDTNLTVTLSRIGLYDLGDVGRLAREHYFRNLARLESQEDFSPILRHPSAFSVIMEGYSKRDADGLSSLPEHSDSDPQVVITMNTCPRSLVDTVGKPPESEGERMTLVRMVINCLSVNAMIRPLREIVSFLSCAWSQTSKFSIPLYALSKSDEASETNRGKDMQTSKSSSCLQVKVVAHYPHIFFIADEGDTHSRALVLRGLAVFNAIISQEVLNIDEMKDLKREISLDVNLQSMESFINADVSTVLGRKVDSSVGLQSEFNNLGIALIQPVTAGIQFQQSSRQRFPTIRTMTVSMESVSTMLSFEDLGLINQVVKSWSPDTVSSGIPSKKKSDDTCMEVHKFETIFTEAKLGLELKKNREGIVVDKAETSFAIQSDDILVAIEGNDVSQKSLNEIAEILTRRPRPIRLQFLRMKEKIAKVSSPHSDVQALKAKGDEQKSLPIAYSLKFKTGVPNGLSVQHSHKGSIPILQDIDVPELVLSLAEFGEDDFSGVDHQLRIPVSGSAILSVNGVKAVDLGFDEILKRLDELTYPQDEEAHGIRTPSTYCISFAEFTAEDWGSIDTCEACITGIALTFIDDFQGRDMPLFRGKLNFLEFLFERGIGIVADKLESGLPSAFAATSDSVERFQVDNCLSMTQQGFANISSECIMKISGSHQFDIDYYHPRIALWEPFVEPSQLAFDLIWKPGFSFHSVRRFGQLIFEIGDRTRSNVDKQPVKASQIGISVNITDAVAEVGARTLRQFSNWKEKMLHSDIIRDVPYHSNESGNDNNGKVEKNTSSDNLAGESFNSPSHQSSRRAKRAATRAAAQAALLFAQKRGVHTQMKSDSAKPFLFRNKTGLQLEFQVLVGRDVQGSAANLPKRVVEVDGEERFQIEMLNLDYVDNAASSGLSAMTTTKKIRSYDGRFPPLGVWIEFLDGVHIDPLLDLQVSKVGVFARELKISVDGRVGTFVLPLIWQVELDDNRRILTLSGAVQVMSIASGLSLNVGVARDDSTLKGTSIEMIGNLEPEKPFFIPLWLSLRFVEQEIHLKPSGKVSGLELGWSHISVLRFRAMGNENKHWIWVESFPDAISLICDAPESFSNVFSGYRLSCVTTNFELNSLKGTTLKSSIKRNNDGSRRVPGIINILVDSCATLKNMLPMPLRWQISDTGSNIFDGQAIGGSDSLLSGGKVEVYAMDTIVEDMFLRMRPLVSLKWTEWVCISAKSAKVNTENKKDNIRELGYHQTVHGLDDFGVPFQFGIKVTPKCVQSVRGRRICYALDIAFYAELWFQNLTSLPLSLGCPWSQLYSEHQSLDSDCDLSIFDKASQAAAESTLMEIASVLEFGDKGKGLGDELGKIECDFLFNIPLQSSQQIHEVFEYTEVDQATVRRHWWAAEHHDSLRKDIADLPNEGSYWEWIDKDWILDCSGEVKIDEGAWESCRSLSAGRETFFSGSRTFDRNHRFRRRRWFRRFKGESELLGLRSGITACHHPTSEIPLVNKASTNKFDDGRQNEKQKYKFALRNQDSEWSSMFEIPETGPAEGIIRVLSSRWPIVTRKNSTLSQKRREVSLDPDVFELCYSVSELPGEWGEFSRIVKITPRFFVKNNSSSVAFEMKQAGVLDSASLKLHPGEISPFFWKDFRLPALVCIRPIDPILNSYRWSGAFDICTMGTFPLRIRPRDGWEADQSVLSIKAMIELRSVSSGANISLLEEDVEFVGGMFRVENNSPFPIWMAQDGVLSNPILAQDVNVTKISSESYALSQYQKKNLSLKPPEIDGDVVLPGGKKLFALDVPFRQGKYANRRAATFEELLRVRIGLAPLSSRSGIETAKVISFTSIGDSIRLNPTKLDCLTDFKNAISGIRILGIVVTYGPTRVLRFELMEKVSSRGDVMGSVSSHGVYTPSQHPRFVVNSKEVNDKRQEFLHEITIKSAVEASVLKSNGKVPKESEVRRGAFFHEGQIDLDAKDIENDIIFTFQGSFSAILFSLVDSAPSEIATVSIKGLEAAAKWNLNRTKDATSFVSIAWIQVDNHIPSAPYPVALCPDRSERGHQSKDHETTPLLAMAFKFAPKHHSGFLCLRHVTIAPSNLAIAVDLAFVIRLQGLLLSIRQHFSRDAHFSTRSNSECIPLPEFVSIMDRESEFGSNSYKLYFEGLTILPSNINFSVAPARGLNAAQAQLEGSEAAAIHTAVRKGDIRLIDGGVVGVSIGKKNQTVIAVLKGMFKSILVDALLRLDGASLYFSGVSLRNHESSGQNLKAFLVAHYLTSLRENMPSLLGSLAAFGNPLGLIKGIGDGVSDFVSEPVKGLKRSVKELDPIHVVDGVARGTESLARHTVGGIADSASMLTETFSKNMAVLTLDRNYAQRRDIARGSQNEDFKFVEGIESGVAQLVRGVIEGVTGVVHAPLRGAEKRGLEGFAKGIGKGLLGLLVKPVIGLSDAATDVMIGVKGSVDGGRQSSCGVQRMPQLRPRRTMYGKDRILRLYSLADAAAASLMLRTRLAGENYVSHLDMGDKVLLISDKKFVLLGMDGQEILLVKLKSVTDVSLEQMECLKLKQTQEWGVVIRLSLKVHGYDKTQVEILSCGTSLNLAHSLLDQLKRALSITSNL